MIAKKYGVKVGDVMRSNPYVNIYNLQVGDELCIPVRDTAVTIPGTVPDTAVTLPGTLPDIAVTLPGTLPDTAVTLPGTLPDTAVTLPGTLPGNTGRPPVSASFSPYIVTNQDTLATILENTNTPFEELVRYNKGLGALRVPAGTVILVPSKVQPRGPMQVEQDTEMQM